ncbi:acyloxyacyl hydrolase [Qipengyuania sediminis]|uniref:acyloxyacyl hydrolase n=1 Tax=Qipengyuania sediminis TaxID=1532023 RepID=UPI001404AE56|nr:acyloxyacyl hydrolase [Qipengyuania sediminis]
MVRYLLRLLPAALIVFPGAASAQEVFAGIYAHGVETPFTFDTGEGGADLQLGVRGSPIMALKAVGAPAPYALVSVNTAAGTDFVAAGLAWKIAVGPVYIRPGVGLSLNNGPERRVDPVTGLRTDLGSAVLFEPELGIGIPLGRSTSIEASWVHISGGRLFNSEQNPGIDMFGVRLSQRL